MTAIVWAWEERPSKCQYLQLALQLWGPFSDLRHGAGQVPRGVHGCVKVTLSTVAPLNTTLLWGNSNNPEPPTQ